MTDSIIIAARYRGPMDSGNGGYVGGALARRLAAWKPGSVAEVTFRKPTPLDQSLALVPDGDSMALKNGETLIADARANDFSIDVPKPPSWDDCLDASARGGSFAGSNYAICFSCGRNHPDGLHVFSAEAKGVATPMVASAWRPRPELGIEQGKLPVEYLWSALDCSGGIALSMGNSPEEMLTGRMAAKVDADLPAGENYRVIGWRIGEDGRKRYAGTAIFDASDRLRGVALATWIVLNRA